MAIFETIEKATDEARQDLRAALSKQLSGGDNIDDDEPAGFRTQGVVFGDVPPTMKASDYLKSAVGWVYAAVSAISDAIAQIELKLYQADKDGNISEIPDDPILDLLYRVNPYQTEYDHRWLSQQYLELAGESPWFVDRGPTGKGDPQNMLLLRPDMLSVIRSSGNASTSPISGYTYKIGNEQTIQIGIDELIFLKYPDPVNPFRGKGTLSAAASTVDVDTFSEDFNKRFFYNSARPDSILRTEQKLSPSQRDELRRSINKLYSGREKAHKTAVLESGLDWKPMSISQKDMDFLEQQKYSYAKILAIFRVPKAIVAISDDVNLANAKIAEYVFSKWTVRPKMTRIVAQLNEFLLPMFADSEGKFLSFADPVPQDIELQIKQHQAALGAGGGVPYMTINEVRADIGQEDIGPDGDKLYIPSTLLPIELAGSQSAQPAPQAGKTIVVKSKSMSSRKRAQVIANSGGGYTRAINKIAAINKVVVKKTEKQKAIENVEKKIDQLAMSMAKKVMQKQWTTQQKKEETLIAAKVEFGHGFIKAADGYERAFTKITKEQFARQQKQILAKMGKKAPKVQVDDFLLDPEDESQVLVSAYTPEMKKIVGEQGSRAMLMTGTGAAFDEATKVVQQFIKNRTFQFSFETTEETNNLLKASLTEGVASGEGIDQLRRRVQDVFDGMEKYRAERIARSEVIRASNFATREAYHQSGVVEQLEWLVTDDDRLCPLCAPLSGKTISIKDSFFSRGDTVVGADGSEYAVDYESIDNPPLHPNCRCTIIPVIK